MTNKVRMIEYPIFRGRNMKNKRQMEKQIMKDPFKQEREMTQVFTDAELDEHYSKIEERATEISAYFAFKRAHPDQLKDLEKQADIIAGSNPEINTAQITAIEYAGKKAIRKLLYVQRRGGDFLASNADVENAILYRLIRTRLAAQNYSKGALTIAEHLMMNNPDEQPEQLRQQIQWFKTKRSKLSSKEINEIQRMRQRMRQKEIEEREQHREEQQAIHRAKHVKWQLTTVKRQMNAAVRDVASEEIKARKTLETIGNNPEMNEEQKALAASVEAVTAWRNTTLQDVRKKIQELEEAADLGAIWDADGTYQTLHDIKEGLNKISSLIYDVQTYQRIAEKNWHVVKKQKQRQKTQQPHKASREYTAPKKHTKTKVVHATFVPFYNVKSFYAEGLAKPIQLRTKKKHDHVEETAIEDFVADPSLWGTWKIAIQSERRDYFRGKLVEKVTDRDKNLETKIIRKQFKDLYGVNKREFTGKYKILWTGKRKILVIESDALRKGARRDEDFIIDNYRPDNNLKKTRRFKVKHIHFKTVRTKDGGKTLLTRPIIEEIHKE